MPTNHSTSFRNSRSWDSLLIEACDNNKILSIRTTSGGHLSGTAKYYAHEPARRRLNRPPLPPPALGGVQTYSQETTYVNVHPYLIVDQTTYGKAYIPVGNIDYFSIMPDLEVNCDRAS